MSEGHQCLHLKEFLELSHFTGTVEQSIKDIRGDIDGLGANIRDLSRCIKKNNTDITKMKTKSMVIGAILGVTGSAIAATLINLAISKMFT
jgi:hypothetical protein